MLGLILDDTQQTCNYIKGLNLRGPRHMLDKTKHIKVETPRWGVSSVNHPHSHVPAQSALRTLAYVKEY